MSLVHVHLLLNHVPVIGAVIGLLLLIAALVRRSDELAKASFALFAVLALVALAVFFTGEPAEDAVKRQAGFIEELVEQHEEVALIATIALSAAGATALVALVVFRQRVLPRAVTSLGAAVAVTVVALMGYTANLGGQIRHTEIRSDRGAALDGSRSGEPSGETEEIATDHP